MDDKKEIKTEIIHKEIDLIQACISRMASNSFFLKGWLITLVAIVLAMISKTNYVIIIGSLLLIFIIFCFWYLDAFFLRAEKMYRKLYEWVLIERPKGNDDKLYDLNPNRFSNEVGNIIKVMFSPTLRFFYAIPMLLIILIVAYNISINYLKC